MLKKTKRGNLTSLHVKKWKSKEKKMTEEKIQGMLNKGYKN